MASTIPLDVHKSLGTPDGAARMQAQFGGSSKMDRDGSVYASVGNRPIPPPKAMRSMHAHRQEERQQREDEEEAEAYEKAHGMGVKEDRTAMHFEEDGSAEAVRRKRELAQRDLEARLCDVAFEYEIEGCGLDECNGVYEYSTASSHGAPVYQSKAGWTLHRGRPPVEATIGSGEEVTEFGWMLSKGGKPMYAVKTEGFVAPASGWQCFYGPPPTPSRVSHSSWERHFTELCGPLKDAGNLAVSQGKPELAQERYTEALGKFDGYDDLVSSSEKLAKLVVTLYANRAEVCLRLRQWNLAIDDSKQALEREPTHVKAGVRLAKACRAVSRWDEAVGPLRKLLDALGPQGNTEVKSMLDEAELLAACEAGSSRLSAAHAEARRMQQEIDRGRLRRAGPGAELEQAALTLAQTLRELEDACASDLGLQRDLRLLLQGMSVLDAAIAAATDEDDPADWGLDLLGACVGPQLREDSLRRVLEALPAAVPQFRTCPQRALELVRRLLKHRLREQLKVADTIIEVKGLLAGCLPPWFKLLETRFGEEQDDRVVEVMHQLGAQVTRLDNLEAFALAQFVECFIGQKLEKGVTGGFSLYLGGGVRQVVLDMFRRWGEDSRILQSLAPDLIGRVWASVSAKLRRDAGLEVEKALPAGQGGKRVLKLEWFKLKDASVLNKGVGAFYPEELLSAVLIFLKAHLAATCERGCERRVSSGISARHPAEEWTDEVLDRPFAWGVLLPLVMGPPSVATPALALLEALISRHPHNEKLAKRLAGLHVFMPLLKLPWPQAQPAMNGLERTLAAGPLARRGVCALLRCTIDTEIGVRVASDVTSLCLQAVLNLWSAVLKDREHPESIIAVIEVLGIITGNSDCWDKVPEDMIFEIVEEFLHNTHKPTRNQLAKLLRAIHTHPSTGPVLLKALEDEKLGLSEEQQHAALQEIFDVKTLAGQARAEQLTEAKVREQQQPAESLWEGEKAARQAEVLAAAIHERYLRGKDRPRILVMGRIARVLCRCFGDRYNSCRVVLGETTLDKLSKNDLGRSVQPVLLPVPQGVKDDSELGSQEHFDLVITGEPMGYFDVGEYADKLRPFIKRREKEDDREKDQVQWVCIEMQEGIEDARDEMYSGGYYKAEHDKGFETLRKVALKMEHDVALFSLPSYERENRKRSENQAAIERKCRREKEEEAQARKDEENEQRRNVLCETLFDAMLSPVEVSPLPVAFEVGAPQGEADLVFFWLHGNSEDPEAHRGLLEDVVAACEARVRVVAATFPDGCSQWYRWSDEVAVNYGMEFYEMSEGPTDEAIEKAKKEPAKNISFGKPSFEEMQCLEELEPCSKQLLNLAEDEVAAGMPEGARLAFGGFAQGGSVATYAALSFTASEEVQSRLCAVMPCCSGVPVLHFLAPKMQKVCLAAQEQGIRQQPIRVHMVYGKGDPEVKESFVETARDMYQRFDFPVTLCRFAGTFNSRFPEDIRKEQLRKALKLWTKPS